MFKLKPHINFNKEKAIIKSQFFQPKLAISRLQRKCQYCEEEENKLQRKETDSNKTIENASIENYISSLNDKGNILNNKERNFFEPRFGYDFSKIKIHADNEAVKSAQSINALAYTSKNNIVFGANGYQPNTTNGKKLLAHELTHVIQQQKNSSLIQRKETADAQTQTAKDMFDDDSDAFKSYGVKFTFAGFNASQKEPIKAIKEDDIINVTIGKAYINESDETTRQSFIKAEIVDKIVKPDMFEDLAYDPLHSKLNEINPPYRAGQYCQLNCPATAAALSDYLKTGKINKAYCDPLLEGGKGYGFDISKNTFSKSFSWKDAASQIKKQLRKHGDFVVVEATRSAKQQNDNHLAANHYFTALNVRGHLFAIDAFGGGIVNDDLQNYIDTSIIATSYRLVHGAFTVTPVIQ